MWTLNSQNLMTKFHHKCISRSNQSDCMKIRRQKRLTFTLNFQSRHDDRQEGMSDLANCLTKIRLSEEKLPKHSAVFFS